MAYERGASALMRDKTPFPTKQMFVLALCRICEPIAFMSIFPYAYYMVKSFGIAKSEADIAIYVGMITSAFAFAECATGMLWGRLSDRVGRKRVLLGGLFGTGLSMCLFGFSRNLPMALIARALGGLLNGNIGVLQTTVAELVTVEKHQPRAYSIMPFVWCLGTIVGSSLGGILAEPVKNYPSLFTADSIFETYPFLLPNLVCTAVVLVGLVIGILFLEETHEDIKYERDRGLEAGRWIVGKILGRELDLPYSEKDGSLDETRSMLSGDGLPAYRSTDSSPTLCSSRSSLAEPPPFSIDSTEKGATAAPRLRDAFTKQVCLNIIGYGILAFHTISLEQLIPLLMSMPEPKTPPQLPFKFTAGFALSTKTIGIILSVQGALQMVAQIIIFPWVSRKLGSLRTFWLVIASYPFLYLITPYLALVPKALRFPGIFMILAWKVTAQSMSYPSLAILLANAAPSKKVLGTLNGAAASSASVCRGFGPTVTGAIQTVGVAMGYSGLAWWVCAGVALLAWIPGSLMKEERKRHGVREAEHEDEEARVCGRLEDIVSDNESVLTLAAEEGLGAVSVDTNDGMKTL